MAAETRSLHGRVKALAQRFDAIAIGAERSAARSLQDADNARRDAKTLHEAAKFIERGGAVGTEFP